MAFYKSLYLQLWVFCFFFPHIPHHQFHLIGSKVTPVENTWSSTHHSPLGWSTDRTESKTFRVRKQLKGHLLFCRTLGGWAPVLCLDTCSHEELALSGGSPSTFGESFLMLRTWICHTRLHFHLVLWFLHSQEQPRVGTHRLSGFCS